MTMDLLEVWIGAIIILSIYSFLYNDNRIYRIVLNTCIGIGTGYTLVITWKQVLGPLWWDKMWGYLATTPGSDPFSRILRVIAEHPGAFAYFMILGLLGSLWYFQTSRKYMWLSRIVIGITIGANGGIIFKQQLLPNVPQIIDSARPLLSGKLTPIWPNGQPWIGSGVPLDIWQSLSNVIFLVGIVTVMVYFFFSFDHTNRVVKRTAGLGRWLLMILFGGFFGNTIMTRMAILLQNIKFLHDDWAPARVPFLFNMQSGVVALALAVSGVIVYFMTSGRKPKKPSGPSSSEPEDEMPKKVASGA